jgi:chromosome segregation ATPase
MEDIETGIESTESGASEGSSTEASDSSSESGSTAHAAAPEQKQPETPFHEHPRFKELVEQKNEALRRYQEMESRYKTIEQQVSSLKDSQPKAPSETDQLIADLKKVDPRLANVIEQQLKAAKTAESVQARLEQFEKQSQESARQNQLSTAVAKINSLHDSNKMSEFGKQFINNQLDLAYRGGQLNAGDLKAVEAAYAEASKAIKSYEENLKRDLTKSYVESKAKDANVPASVPKGAPAKAAQKPLNVPKDKEALKSTIVKSFLKEQAANRDATNV